MFLFNDFDSGITIRTLESVTPTQNLRVSYELICGQLMDMQQQLSISKSELSHRTSQLTDALDEFEKVREKHAKEMAEIQEHHAKEMVEIQEQHANKVSEQQAHFNAQFEK